MTVAAHESPGFVETRACVTAGCRVVVMESRNMTSPRLPATQTPMVPSYKPTMLFIRSIFQMTLFVRFACPVFLRTFPSPF